MVQNYDGNGTELSEFELFPQSLAFQSDHHSPEIGHRIWTNFVIIKTGVYVPQHHLNPEKRLLGGTNDLKGVTGLYLSQLH